MRRFIIYTLHPILLGHMDSEMGGTCNTHWRNKKYIIKSKSEKLSERDCLEDLGIDGQIILKCLGVVGCQVVN